jgi:hypothetical protein
MSAFKITLPIPLLAIGPNGRVHWAKKSMLVKRHRALAWGMVRMNASLRDIKPTGYSLAFYFRTNRRRDDDNAEACCKAYRDGIAEALNMDDHDLPKAGLSTFAVDAKNPRLEITLHL